jgi:AcrR family transcriptional regulator
MARPRKITDEEILNAAKQVFLEKGVEASTLEIAELAGISEGSIFKRFSTKRALFLAAMSLSANPPWAKLLSQQEPTAETKQQLIQVCIQMIEGYQEILPRVMMVASQGQMPFPPPGGLLPPPIRDRQLLETFLLRAIANGYLHPSCDATTASYMIVGTIVNYVMSQTIATKMSCPLPGLPTIPPEELSHSLVNSLWHGIAPES